MTVCFIPHKYTFAPVRLVHCIHWDLSFIKTFERKSRWCTLVSKLCKKWSHLTFDRSCKLTRLVLTRSLQALTKIHCEMVSLVNRVVWTDGKSVIETSKLANIYHVCYIFEQHHINGLPKLIDPISLVSTVIKKSAQPWSSFTFWHWLLLAFMQVNFLIRSRVTVCKSYSPLVVHSGEEPAGELVRGEICTEAGVFHHPTDCTKFYNCPEIGELSYELNCPKGLFFNKGGYCNYRCDM